MINMPSVMRPATKESIIMTLFPRPAIKKTIIIR